MNHMFVVLLAAAAASPSPSRLAAGDWGGQGITLAVKDSGVAFELDCAHGTLEEAPVLDAQGRFKVKGTLVREFGPVRINGPKGQPVRFEGRLEKEELTLTLFSDAGEDQGSFTLGLGRQPRLRKCK